MALLVVGITSIVDLVARIGQSTRNGVVVGVVHTIETNLVAIAETAIVDTSDVLLRDISVNSDLRRTRH